jgi:hypothetical protein
MTEFNKTQLKFFKMLVDAVKENDVDITKIDHLLKMPEFKVWRNILLKIFQKKIKKEENKTYLEMANNHLHDLLIECISKNKFSKRTFNLKIESFENYLTYFQDTFFYFSPLYNFELPGNELIINEFIKIRKITEPEKNYLSNYYAQFSPIKILLSKINYIILINVSKNHDNPSIIAKTKIVETLNKFKIFQSGDISHGGLYVYDKSEKWNPNNKFTRLEIESTGVLSRNTYSVKKSQLTKTKKLFSYIDFHYPTPKIDELKNDDEIKITKNYLDKYHDHFAKVITRFCGALDKNDISEKIVDFILSLETLLVSSPGDSTMKLSQRLALFLGSTDAEKYEIWQYMQTFYNFRSGQIHELTDRNMKVPNLPQITKDNASKKLEIWTRHAILKMMIFSQNLEFNNLSIKQIYKKIDESMFNSKLKNKFLKLDTNLKPFQ